MKKTLIAIGLLCAISTQAATIFETSINTSPGTFYDLKIGATGTTEFAWAPTDAVFTEDETGSEFWDKMLAGETIIYFKVDQGEQTVTNHPFPAVAETAGVQFLQIDFGDGTITLRGLDALGDIEDVGPDRIRLPDGGATAGLLGLGLATVAVARRRIC